MELLITLLPTIASYLTGMLIAWSTVTSSTMIKVFCFAKTHNKKLRKADTIELTAIIGTAIVLSVMLFGFSAFFVTHLGTIFVLELWYSFFLYCVTEKSIKTLNQAIKVNNNELHPDYMPGQHVDYNKSHTEFIYDLIGKCGHN